MTLNPYKEIKELKETVEQQRQDIDQLQEEKQKLEDKINETVDVTSDTSSITFFVDKDLNVKPKTSINFRDLEDALLNNEFIQQNQVDDETAYHIAMILIANDVTSQIIANYEKNTNKE